jgi:hypothetical protein
VESFGDVGEPSSGSVRYIKHSYPDQRDKSERHERGQGHHWLPKSDYGPKPVSVSPTSLSHSLVLHTYDLRNRSGSLAIFAAIRRAKSKRSSTLLVQAGFSDLGFIPTVLKIYLPSF